jgi:hypothetical protein
MNSTLDGIRIVFTPLSRNAAFPMHSNLEFDSNVTSHKERQSTKQKSPMNSTLDGIWIVFIQPKPNACSSIRCNLQPDSNATPSKNLAEKQPFPTMQASQRMIWKAIGFSWLWLEWHFGRCEEAQSSDLSLFIMVAFDDFRGVSHWLESRRFKAKTLTQVRDPFALSEGFKFILLFSLGFRFPRKSKLYMRCGKCILSYLS